MCGSQRRSSLIQAVKSAKDWLTPSSGGKASAAAMIVSGAKGSSMDRAREMGRTRKKRKMDRKRADGKSSTERA